MVIGLTLRTVAQGMSSSDGAVVTPPTRSTDLAGDAQELSHLLELDSLLAKVEQLRSARACETAGTPEEISDRLTLLEAFQAATLDTDDVLAELGNEGSEITEIRAELASRRDKTVARLNTAALLTGAALGVAVSATQFTTLGSRTQNTGDALGIGSGAASTILSLLAAKKQGGPSGTVRGTPTMLAPLLDESAVESPDYPPSVLRYLHAVPDAKQGGKQTRLELLRAEWLKAGRLPTGGHKTVAALTTSDDPAVKASIGDLSNRIAMLGDVRGRVALMKRDLSALRRMSMGPLQCGH